MVLHYTYENRPYIFETPWTDPEGTSIIFREIISHLEKTHGPAFSAHREQTLRLDLAVDRLYKQIYHFGDEYQAIPYDPKHRKRFLAAYGETCALSEIQEASEEAAALTELFGQVLDKLQEMVEVYLLDNAYQGKHRYRRRHFEEWLETASEGATSCEFESVLIQMTDLSPPAGAAYSDPEGAPGEAYLPQLHLAGDRRPGRGEHSICPSKHHSGLKEAACFVLACFSKIFLQGH